VWKGWALWVAARQNSKPWFVVLLIINTLGILEILYIFIFSKPKAVSGGAPSNPPHQSNLTAKISTKRYDKKRLLCLNNVSSKNNFGSTK